MAGKKPSFITGATAKIKAYGKTIAYAQDVSFNTTVTTIPIETMGRYEVVSNEPVAYFVDGALSVIRYTKEASANGMSGAATTGNAIGSWNPGGGNSGSSDKSFDPSKLLTSESFDLDIFQKTEDGDLLVTKIRDCRMTRKGGGINKRGVLVEQMSFNGILQDNGDDANNVVGGSGDIDLS
jgi:hypothetical protein